MFNAIIIICSFFSEPRCIEIHDTLKPKGYMTEKECGARLGEMMVQIRQRIYYPHTMHMHCKKVGTKT
tara:strand:+ start:323 stop:526 length:204 start_codon:yes stop_codon:yes gene_type:complete